MNTFDVRYMQLKLTKLNEIIAGNASVMSVARELDVTRKTVHVWLLRYRRFGEDGLLPKKRKCVGPAQNRTAAPIEQLVIQLAHEYWMDGVQELSDRLQFLHNITLHPVTIYRILKRLKIRYTGAQPATQRRWKKQLYAHEHPGTELQMDTVYPFGRGQSKVIYTVIDDASRWAYAYGYPEATGVNTVDFLTRVLLRIPFHIQKIRTDNGKEFIARIVETFLKQESILHRRNTPYCPEEDGKIERFNQTFKRKCIRYGGIYSRTNMEEMQYKIALFLGYYNNRRKHRGLGMNGMTPMEKITKMVL
jgi:putative transposase